MTRGPSRSPVLTRGPDRGVGALNPQRPALGRWVLGRWPHHPTFEAWGVGALAAACYFETFNRLRQAHLDSPTCMLRAEQLGVDVVMLGSQDATVLA